MRRRVARHAFTLLSALSLLLCVAMCGLWVRSYYVEDILYRATLERADMLTFTRGRAVLELLVVGHPVPCVKHETSTPGETPRTAREMGDVPDWQHLGIEWSPGVNLFAVSLWWAIAVTALVPVSWLIMRLRQKPGRCSACGYDLRAHAAGGPAMGLSNPRCPECGAGIAGAADSAVPCADDRIRHDAVPDGINVGGRSR